MTEIGSRRPTFQNRWRVLLQVVFGALVCLLVCPCSAQTAATFHDRADEALQSFLLKFWKGSSQYLRRVYPSDGSLTGYWTYAHGWEALLDGVERTDAQQYSGLIESFFEGQDERGWLVGYYDDECWMTLALLHAFDLTSDLKFLNQAAILYADVMNGWDATCCGASKGGVWWDKAHTQKATAANAGAALAGARLYLRTGNSAYLTFARQVYSYWYANMVHSTTHQVCDHINPDGTKIWWRFTYNEGLMIGASLALYDATADSSYIAKAHGIAGFMLSNETITTPYGPALYDGDNSGCGGDCHEFKGPAYRYLMELYARDTTRTGYWNVLRASANALWNQARDTNSILFAVNWAGPPQSSADQAQMNAACIALSRFAQQAGPYLGSGLMPNQYEAENATLHHLGLEALYGSFSGWAYVAGWNANGQSVDFKIDCARADQYSLAFRYAAGAGNASRVVAVNGVTLSPDQRFTDSGAWSVYRTNVLTCSLPAGKSTVSVVFDSSRGSANYLNLDCLTVIPPEAIAITGINLSNSGTVQLGWNAISGSTYQVQFRSSLTSGAWTNLGAPVIATSTSSSFQDNASSEPERYYRIIRVQ